MNQFISPSCNPLTRRDWWIAAAVALAAGFVRALNCSRRGFWIDEYITLNVARMPARELIANRFSEGHAPLYFFYAKLGPLLGDSEWALRLTSVVMVVAAVLLVTGLAGALNLRGALPTIWVLALVNPYWFTIGTQYRYMMLLVAFSALTGWLAVEYARSWVWWRGLLAALALGLMLWLHASMQFFAFVLGIFILWEAIAQHRRPVAKIILSLWPVALGLLLSAPQAYLIVAKKMRIAPRKPDLRALLGNVAETAFGNPRLWPRCFNFRINGALVAVIIVLLVVLWMARRHLRSAGNWIAWRFLASWFVGIPLLIVFYSWRFHHLHEEARYLCTISVPAMILLAVAWRAECPNKGRLALRAGILILLLIQLPAVILDRGDLHREGAQWLIQNHSGTEPVILASFPTNAMAMKYLGFKHPELLAGPPDPSLNKKELCDLIREKLKGHNRAFFMFYFQSKDTYYAMKELKRSGFFVEQRVFRYSGLVIMVAVALDPSQRAWVRGLPSPLRPWGPAAGNNMYNPRFNLPTKFKEY